ncbi:MAG: MotA/TolQ/ExbB proton channel family protein [Planctomycetota bacterium]|nr:MotA/TolQ/ExbB proton channel family protein [Planctomycetota bacterium]
MRNVVRQIVVFCLLLSAIGFGAAAAGQSDEPGFEPRSARTPATGSFADHFFIARKTDPNGEQSVEMIGSLIIWFLLGLSVVSIGLIGHMALANQRKSIVPPEVVEQARRLMAGGSYRGVLDFTAKDHSFFSQVLLAGLREANHGFGAVIRSLQQTSDELTSMRLRQIEYLNVLGQVSPMIGLFGTVYGMILAFQAIVTAGGNADPVLLAGGIGTALTTTFWGLVVAIPALAGYAIIRNKIDELTTEATLAAEGLLNQFRPKPAAKPGPPEAKPEARR